MSLKLIVWDFNGTIVDDVKLCYDIETRMLQERHMRTYTLEQYRDMFCFPVIEYYYKMGYTFEEESYEDISVEFNKFYDEGFPSLQVMEDFAETIQMFKENGLENVIISASRQDKLLAQCDQLGISSYFTKILGTDNLLGGSKIEIARKFMKEHHVLPEECMYIGDSLHDVETATAMGISNIQLVARGHQSKKVLSASFKEVHDALKETVYDEEM